MSRVPPIPLGALVIQPAESGPLFTLWNAADADARYSVMAPWFEVEGRGRGQWRFAGFTGERRLPRGGQELTLRYEAAGEPVLSLEVRLRGFAGSPLLRMRYRLSAAGEARLTRRQAHDAISYWTLKGKALDDAALAVVQLSHFDPVAHSYLPAVELYAADEREGGLETDAPLCLFHGPERSFVAAYEHGADTPAGFLAFGLGSDIASLTARRGNYYDGQPIGPGHAWESVWLQLGAAPLPLDAMLARYRAFVLDEMCENSESRQPYLFYNTWNHQERNKYFRGLPYLHDMREQRMRAEVDVAHRLGIDVFVIDTGWYGKTGDWRVNLDRFPDGLRGIREQLEAYGMKLGLWFNPTVAALSSEIFQSHPEYEMTRGGEPLHRGPIWETEESASMCLASGYADAYIETLVRLHEELGVSYFKWDAISQYGCDSPLHNHGAAANTPAERAECYAFESGRQMIRIVEEVTRRCPGVIVDFDVTEGGRFVGLGFLSVGKYFLVNNGPYFHDFDIPRSVKMEPDTINAFFYPGAARPRVCRTGARYDAVIPSILFLTHYLPDGPALAQRNSLASLMLGGNGIWGDLVGLSEDDIALIAGQLASYKRVAEGVTRAVPRVRGFAGSSPEVHEKIDAATGSGLVALFTVTPGTFAHTTQPLPPGVSVEGADSWERLDDGRVRLSVDLGRNDARVVFLVT
jgi:alpha-galactosidase